MRDIVAALDIGTTKICALFGKEDMGSIVIASMGSSPSNGLKKGIVVDMDKTSQSIKRALAEAEEAAGFRIGSVCVGIAGGHIMSFNGCGTIGIRHNVVKEEDVQRLMDSATDVYVSVEREILHVIPTGFRLDGRNGIMDPVGMHCERLEADLHVVTGSVKPVQNLIKCCEDAGVEVADIILEPLASAESVLRAEEKERGVGLVDIGGGTTDIAVYKNGVLRHTAVLAIGGNHVTNDIAVVLGITAADAEKAKKAYGCALNVAVAEEEIDITGAGNNRCRVSKKHIAEVIRMRCDELMFMVRRKIESMSGFAADGLSAPYISNIVLTGGASLLNGIDVMAEKIIGLPVRIGLPEGIRSNFDVKSPVYATGIGLIRYGLEQDKKRAGVQTQDALTSINILERMKCWAGDFMNKKNLIKGGSLCLKSKM